MSSLIQTIENKVRLSLTVSVLSFLLAIIITCVSMVTAYQMVATASSRIYVLENGLPMLLTKTDLSENREVEAKSHIRMYHRLFFTLPPDNKFITASMDQAMYLVDESGMGEYNSLREKGFFNSLISSSSACTIQDDSIFFDLNTNRFRYHGTQRIERRTSILFRELVTEGDLRSLRDRTPNNPHAFIIQNWRIVRNRDVEKISKRQF